MAEIRLLGVDIGTTGSKAVIFDASGHQIASAYGDYPLHTGASGEATLDAAQVLTVAEAAILEACRKAGEPGPSALATAAQGEAFMPVDAGGHPLGPAIVTFDRRGEQGVGILRQHGWGQRQESAGLPLSWIVTAAKLAFARSATPSSYQTATRFLCFEDLLVARLTGEPVISDSLAQRTFLLDRRRTDWDPRSLAELDLQGRLARIVPSGRPAGTVTAARAAELGLRPGCLVVAGAHDQTAALIGSGAIAPGTGAHSTGTVDCLSLLLPDRALGDLGNHGYGLGVYPLPDLAVTLAFGFGGGALLQWWRQTLSWGGASPTVADLLAEAEPVMTPEAALPCAVPFWSGSGTPDLDAADRGALLSLTLDTTRGDITAALVRGMILETERNLSALRRLGIEVSELRLVGGGSRNATWNQLRADLLGVPYVEVDTREAGCLGAAMLAGLGAGIFTDLQAAGRAMVRLGRRYQPRPSAHPDMVREYGRAVRATRAVRG